MNNQNYIGKWFRVLPSEWSMEHGWNGQMGQCIDHFPAFGVTDWMVTLRLQSGHAIQVLCEHALCTSNEGEVCR